jgi:hypothetical protein
MFTQDDSDERDDTPAEDGEQSLPDAGISCTEWCPDGLYCDFAGRCVECLYDDQCDGCLVCRYGQCEPGCSSDRDCLAGMRCNKQVSQCVLQRCDWDGECPPFSACLGEYCVPVDPDEPPDDMGDSQSGDFSEGTQGAGGVSSDPFGHPPLEAGTPDASVDAGDNLTF